MTNSSTPEHAAALDQVVEHGNQRIAAFQREALLAHVFRVQVALQSFRRRELAQDVDALLGGELLVHAPAHELILQPQALVGVRHMRELRADGACEHVFQQRNDVAQLARAAARHRCGWR